MSSRGRFIVATHARARAGWVLGIQAQRSLRALTTCVHGGDPGIPIIDISPFRRRTAAGAHADAESIEKQQQKTAAALGAACEHVGFFYVTNHGVDASLLKDAQSMARRFFSRELKHKLKFRMPLHNGADMGRGYQQVLFVCV
jgi:hypothetical protein